jgi:hypothetical protein
MTHIKDLELRSSKRWLHSRGVSRTLRKYGTGLLWTAAEFGWQVLEDEWAPFGRDV